MADQKVPPGSGGAPHYYLPPQIFRLCNMPGLVVNLSLYVMKFVLALVSEAAHPLRNASFEFLDETKQKVTTSCPFMILKTVLKIENNLLGNSAQ